MSLLESHCVEACGKFYMFIVNVEVKPLWAYSVACYIVVTADTKSVYYVQAPFLQLRNHNGEIGTP